MGIDDCLILLFDYLIVVVISCVLNLNDWYKRGNYSVGGSVLVLVGGVLSKAIEDEEISLATVESHLIGIAMNSTLRRKIIQDLKEVF